MRSDEVNSSALNIYEKTNQVYVMYDLNLNILRIISMDDIFNIIYIIIIVIIIGCNLSVLAQFLYI